MNRDILNIIVNMAARDHQIVDKELKIIQMIGQANGFSKEDIKEMIEKPQPIKDLSNFSESERFETLYHLIQLMKVDHKVFKSEINFCKDIANKLGYKKEVVGSLSAHIYADPHITVNREILMKKANKFLK